MQPDPIALLQAIDLDIPLIGVYDAPDASPFEPLVKPQAGTRPCVFAFFDRWLQGETLHLTAGNFGCGGAGNWLWGISARPREDFVCFLVDDEGLKTSHELMHQWLDRQKPYRPEYSNLLVGRLRADQYAYLKTAAFYVNADQLSMLITGAHYHHTPGSPAPVIAPFGAGCMELLPLLSDLDSPRALIGATDIAMRRHLPPDILAFTVTKAMFGQLCELGEESFLCKPFWGDLKRARGLGGRQESTG